MRALETGAARVTLVRAPAMVTLPAPIQVPQEVCTFYPQASRQEVAAIEGSKTRLPQQRRRRWQDAETAPKNGSSTKLILGV